MGYACGSSPRPRGHGHRDNVRHREHITGEGALLPAAAVALAKATPGCSAREGCLLRGAAPASPPRCCCRAGACPSTPAVSCAGQGSGPCSGSCLPGGPSAGGSVQSSLPARRPQLCPAGLAGATPRAGGAAATWRSGPRRDVPARRRTGRALPPERDPRCPRGGAGLGCPGSARLCSARLCAAGLALPARPGPGRPWGARRGGGPAAGGSGEAPPAGPLARSPAGHARPQDAGLGDPARHAACLHYHRHVDRVSAAGRPGAAARPPPHWRRGRGCRDGVTPVAGRDAAGQGAGGRCGAGCCGALPGSHRAGVFLHAQSHPHLPVHPSHPAWSLRPSQQCWHVPSWPCASDTPWDRVSLSRRECS